jgi:hypothetical protein
METHHSFPQSSSGIIPNGSDHITASPVAPSLRRLRSGTSSTRPCDSDEVLPHYDDTQKKDALDRTAQGLLAQGHTDRGTPPATTQSRGFRRARVDSEQLGSPAGTAGVCRSATSPMGCNHALSVRRAGDCLRQSVGPQEAARVASVAFVRGVTESGKGIQFRYDVGSILPTGTLSLCQSTMGPHGQSLQTCDLDYQFPYCHKYCLPICKIPHSHDGVASD